MSEAKGANRSTAMVELLEKWQAIERKSIEQCSEIMSRTQNPLVRQVMEIIRNDSGQHHRVQQFLIDTLTKQAASLTPEELAEIWDKIEEHIALERETVELAKELKKKAFSVVHKVILEYLLIDEEKHDRLLDELEQFKKGMYPYA